MTTEPKFEAISFDSERGVNPIMIYRLKSDPSKCFKFIRRRDSCYKCKNTRLATKFSECVLFFDVINIIYLSLSLIIGSNPVINK